MTAAAGVGRAECLPGRCLVDGQPGRVIEVHDRGLAYGDGLFETLAVRAGAPCRWVAHLERLAAGAVRLGIALPPPKRLRAECARISTGIDAGGLKLILTRGCGPRGYLPPAAAEPTRILWAWAASPADGAWHTPVRVRLCEMPLGSNARLAGIKHLNRLEQVLARAEWRDPAIAEGLMRDHEGWVVCATASNLFLVEAEGLVTPPLDRCGVAGTVRACVFEQAAAAGVAVRERRVAVDDLLRARAAFLTSSLAGVRPIGWCEDRGFDPDALPWELLAAVQREALRPESDW